MRLASGRGGKANENHCAIATRIAADVDVKIGFQLLSAQMLPA
jgi:hypothetical protein